MWLGKGSKKEFTLYYLSKPKVITSVILTEEEKSGEPVSEWCGMKKTQPAISGFEGQGRGQKPRNVGSVYKLEKIGKQILLWASRKEYSLTTPCLVLAHHDLRIII